MSAIFPTVSHEPIILRRASSANALIEPADNSIDAAGGYTQAFGTGGAPLLVQIKTLGAADADDDVLIETCDEPTFAVVSVHPDSPKAIDNLASGSVLRFTLAGLPGYLRFKNTSSVAVEIAVWRLPNRS
ncbi:MAG TPA: hypothetical protein VIL74_09045 [Pyrinomonadaceae bacterium]|jgi:hypothetical protein